MIFPFPFAIDPRGRVASTSYDEYVRGLIEQVLFTSPGERVNRPDFGSGVNQLLFALNSDELAAATEFLIQGSLQRWLGELISVEAVQVEREEETLRITIQYIVNRTREKHVTQFAGGLN